MANGSEKLDHKKTELGRQRAGGTTYQDENRSGWPDTEQIQQRSKQSLIE